MRKVQNAMKVLIFEFNQETNSFCPVLTEMEDYLHGSVLEGRQMQEAVRGSTLALNGMFTALEEAGAEIVPCYGMRAIANGPVRQSVLEHFMAKLRQYLAENLPADGVLVSMHGATQSTQDDDVCGTILAAVRQMAGADTVVAASLDLHANVTEQMFRNADFLCGYQTYPHVDLYETGYRAARLAIRAMQGERQLHMARACVPMIIPASGYTTGTGKLGQLVQEAHALVESGVLEDYTIFQMQPWLDVAEGCGTVITVAKDASAALEQADALARRVFELRDELRTELCPIDEVIDKALQVDGGKPVLAVDFSDSTNAGAAGDNAAVLEAVLRRECQPATAFVLIDRPVVEQAFRAGVGARIHVTLGATRDRLRSRSVEADAQVCSLHDGDFRLEGPAMHGVTVHVGKTAHLRIGNCEVVVCEAMGNTGDPQLFRHFGVEISFCQLVVVKACTSFRAAYTPLVSEICMVDTRGAATSELESLPFSKLPRTLYPFSKNAAYGDAGAAQVK